jgi:hypothetical protein
MKVFSLIVLLATLLASAHAGGWTAQPTVAVTANTVDGSVSITFQSAVTESVRCIITAAGDTPTGFQNVIDADGGGGAVVGTCPAAANSDSTAAQTVACTGLTAGTAYKAWCATTDTLSDGTATITPAAQAYSSQPAFTDTGLAGTAGTIAVTVARTESQRCIVTVAAGSPSAAEVTAGNGAGDKAPVGSCPAAASATGASAASLSCTGLSAATNYKVWCATASGVASTGVAFTTAAATTTTSAPAAATTTSAPSTKKADVSSAPSTAIFTPFSSILSLIAAFMMF